MKDFLFKYSFNRVEFYSSACFVLAWTGENIYLPLFIGAILGGCVGHSVYYNREKNPPEN